jgi:hypothetical protein
MRRTLGLASFACLGGLALLAALMSNTWSSADPGRDDKPAAASRSAPQLPIGGFDLGRQGIGLGRRGIRAGA